MKLASLKKIVKKNRKLHIFLYVYRYLKSALNYLSYLFLYNLRTRNQINKRYKNRTITLKNFEIAKLEEAILDFIDLKKIGDFKFKYSEDVEIETLYSSVFACISLGLFNRIEDKQDWASYFDSHQNELDGLFYDLNTSSESYTKTDYWGARHLALIASSAYIYLGHTPKYKFKFLEQYYDRAFLQSWINTIPWDNTKKLFDGDIDNKIMHIGCLLQFQRDFFDDKEASKALEYLKKELIKNLNQELGVWGYFDSTNNYQTSRAIQFFYHLMPIFIYDNNIDSFDFEKICNLTLSTQNSYGGFSPKVNSSACEDIDSIFILLFLVDRCSSKSTQKILDSIEKAFEWIIINQVEDGGFVFKLDESFTYGHKNMFSARNTGSMFASWFRILSIAFIYNKLSPVNCRKFNLIYSPGYIIKV